MSLIMTIYLNDGIVMASDSRTTLTLTQTKKETVEDTDKETKTISTFPFSDSTFKTFEAPNKCGISTCGDSAYLDKPISGFIEKFLISYIDEKTSVEELATKITDYFTNLDSNKTTIFHICGYEKDSSNEYLSKFYSCITGKNKKVELIDTSSQNACWSGETKTLSKLIRSQIIDPVVLGETDWEVENGGEKKIVKGYLIQKENIEFNDVSFIPWHLMTIPDALNFIDFAFATTINDMRFQSIAKTVGGPINILIVKPNEVLWARKNKIN